MILSQASLDQFSSDLQNLSHKDAKIRAQGAWSLGKSGNRDAIEPLIKALGDNDKNVREWSLLALAKIGKPATQKLIAVLGGVDDLLSWQAAAALGLINDTDAVEPLIKSLFGKSDSKVHSNDIVRYWSAISLGKIKDPRAREPLYRSLGDGNQSIRYASGWALLYIDEEKAIDSLIVALSDGEAFRRIGAAETLQRTGSKKAVTPLTVALKDSDAGVRAAAADALGEINESQAIESLIMAMADNANYSRSRAINALINMGPKASSSLIAALSSKDALIKKGAAEALGDIKETKAIDQLLNAFLDKDIRGTAAKALLKIDRNCALEPMLKILSDGNASSDLRGDAALALGDIGDSKANEALLSVMTSGGDKTLKANAAKALRMIKVMQRGSLDSSRYYLTK